jgi:hypothetical protein
LPTAQLLFNKPGKLDQILLTAKDGSSQQQLSPSAIQISGQNSRRDPNRTASTAAALMIGLALVTLVATQGAGVIKPFEDRLLPRVTLPEPDSHAAAITPDGRVSVTLRMAGVSAERTPLTGIRSAHR